MGDKEHNVFRAKLAEQAERFEGKRSVLDAISGLFGVRLLESSSVIAPSRLRSGNSSFDKHFKHLNPSKGPFSICLTLNLPTDIYVKASVK